MVQEIEAESEVIPETVGPERITGGAVSPGVPVDVGEDPTVRVAVGDTVAVLLGVGVALGGPIGVRVGVCVGVGAVEVVVHVGEGVGE